MLLLVVASCQQLQIHASNCSHNHYNSNSNSNSNRVEKGGVRVGWLPPGVDRGCFLSVLWFSFFFGHGRIDIFMGGCVCRVVVARQLEWV